MKLLFDQNLSKTLVRSMADLFPGSSHVSAIGMMTSDDATIWTYALEHGFAIISKDSDFHQRSLVHGAPPKVIWLKVGNCQTSQIVKLLRHHSVELHTFDSDPEQSLLILS